MAEADLDTQSTEDRALTLDPFAHLPGVASRIPGLGGNAPCHDPTYVFHTDYVEVAPGVAHFTINFDALQAKLGTLVLRVHMLPIEAGAHSVLANSARVQLNRLVASGGYTTIRFESFRGVRFALYGSIPDTTDISAAGVYITLDRPAEFADTEELAIDARSSSYSRDKTKAASQLVSLAPATLSNPVCQICTDRQLREPVFKQWAAELDFGNQNAAEQWSSVYVLQVLSRYGMLSPGAAGLGIGVESATISEAIAARGASVLAVRHSYGDTADSGTEDGSESASSQVTFRTANVGNLPRDLVNFDFSWSCGWAARCGSIADGITWIDQMIARLRPGGLAVHTMPYNLSSADDTIEHGEMVLFRRRDIERLVLILISRGHEVAQIKVDAGTGAMLDYPATGDTPYRATTCGIIVRKAATKL